MAFPRPTDFEVGDLDHAPEHNRINEHLNLLNSANVARDSQWLSGTGFPTMSAPVGTRYTDTAATNGAVEWIKASGTGTTGWQVVYGDTGWRRVNDLITEGEATSPGGIDVRRVGDHATVRFITGFTPAGTTPAFITLPLGFRPVTESIWTTRRRSNPSDIKHIRIGSSGGMFSDADVELATASHTYVTDNAWPATLPGDPA